MLALTDWKGAVVVSEEIQSTINLVPSSHSSSSSSFVVIPTMAPVEMTAAEARAEILQMRSMLSLPNTNELSPQVSIPSQLSQDSTPMLTMQTLNFSQSTPQSRTAEEDDVSSVDLTEKADSDIERAEKTLAARSEKNHKRQQSSSSSSSEEEGTKKPARKATSERASERASHSQKETEKEAANQEACSTS